MTMPRERAFDSTLALLRDPYGFIAAGCHRHRSDVFAGRLLLRPTIFMSGRDAAELFYQEERFQRAGAAPRRERKSLFGEGGLPGARRRGSPPSQGGVSPRAGA